MMDMTLLDVSPDVYHGIFHQDPHPYISNNFINLNHLKVDRVVRLVESNTKSSLGLIAGIKRKTLLSPFSAPFGGFHFKKDNQYVGEIEGFIVKLKDYARGNDIHRIEITLPPDLYQQSFNAKVVNVLLRLGFTMKTPNITNGVFLGNLTDAISNRAVRKYYNQALRNNLKFEILTREDEKADGFDIIKQNRFRFGRPIYMTYSDLLEVEKLWPVDYFGVRSESDSLVSAGVFYRGHKKIIQGIFWGDTEIGRPLRAMDFMSIHIWKFYKKLNYEVIDLGISTEEGVPNEGLLRFKESHDCFSSLRFSFYWNRDDDLGGQIR